MHSTFRFNQINLNDNNYAGTMGTAFIRKDKKKVFIEIIWRFNSRYGVLKS